LDLALEVLKLAVPTIIALVSLAYAIKQRKVVKKEIAKKSYLESAQTNLSEAIQRLREVELPSLSDPNCDLMADFEDIYFDTNTIVEDLLRAYFESKKTQFTLKVSFELVDFGETDKSYSERNTRKFNDFSQSSPKLLIDLSKSGSFCIYSETDILDVQRRLGNSPSFDPFVWSFYALRFALSKLSEYEEVYETVCPSVVKQANQLLEGTVEQVFKVISVPRTVEIDLKEFSKTDDITKHLIDTLLDYTHISEKLSQGISELDSKLTKARKELFLKISA
jgi:hypothetical protein